MLAFNGLPPSSIPLPQPPVQNYVLSILSKHSCSSLSAKSPLSLSPLKRALLILQYCTPAYVEEMAGQWIESVTDWAISIIDWSLFPDWVSSHARLADSIRPMPDKGNSEHPGLPIALISRLPDWAVQSVLPIAIHRLLHRFYPLASPLYQSKINSNNLILIEIAFALMKMVEILRIRMKSKLFS